MPNYQRKVVYLSDEQFHQLVNNGSITVNGVTVTYNEYDMYVTPQKDPIVTTEALAPEYSELTFPVAAGQHCTQNGNYYVTENGIQNSEAWTTAHWTQLTVGGEATALKSALNDKYEKPSGGIPSTDLADSYIEEPASDGTSGQVLTTDGQGGRSWQTVQGGGGGVSDVQVNETSVVSSGVANIPIASSSNPGVVKITSNSDNSGILIDNNNNLLLSYAISSTIKAGSSMYRPIVPNYQHHAVFYGLAKAAGDSTQSSSSNSVGTYTESAKSAISQMLDAPETVSGSTPSITAKAGVRYICGECSTLTIVVPASGCIDVVFKSGSTPTVLTVTPPTGVTAVKWMGSFDPTSLEANTTYEINIMDGEWGMAVSWT